jgi:hypothetical protein
MQTRSRDYTGVSVLKRGLRPISQDTLAVPAWKRYGRIRLVANAQEIARSH